MHGNERIPEANRRWQQYRLDVTNYIASECRHGERILILGAGGCDDLDLEWLLQKETEIWLSDINEEAMQEAITEVLEQAPQCRERIHRIKTDLIAMPDELIQQYDAACLEGIDALNMWWQKYMQAFAEQALMTKDILKEMRKSGVAIFDKVICLGLHSQLYVALAVRTYQLGNKLTEEVRKAAIQWLQQVNDMTAEKFLNEFPLLGRELYLGLEYTTMYAENPEVETEIISQLESYGEEGLVNLKLPRVEGAWQMEQELWKQSQEHRLLIRDRQYLIWPFSEEKRYLMVIYSLLCYNG